MARIRSIHPGLTSDEAYMSMSMAAKAAWTPLWMQCDDHGIFEWKPIVLKALIFPADAVDFAALLDEWVQLGCIRKIEIEGKPFGIVRNFAKYQRPKNPSYRHFKPDNLPTDVGKFIGVKGAATPALPQSSGSTPEKPPQRKEEGGSREEEEGNEESKNGAVADATRPTDSDFEEFWEAYPRRKGANPKAPAAKLFAAAVKAGILAEAIIAAARRCASADADKVGTEFIPQAVTWLEEKRWQDYPEPAAKRGAELDWDGQLSRFQRGQAWSTRHWGPEPGQIGCRAPAELLAKHGFAAAH